MNQYSFAPGCALFLYKPGLIRKLQAFLDSKFGPLELVSVCCHFTPPIPPGIRVISTCPGCDRRYRENYPEPLSVSLWELLAADDAFPFPDYRGEKMTIIDACPTRNQERIHRAVRALAGRMNIAIVEPARSGRNGTCCGDTYYGVLPNERVIGQMKAKGREMPAEDILVYCVSCSKSMFVAGRRPRYLVDLLFGEETVPGTYQPDLWHRELDAFMEKHTGGI
jgi:hypothetical protein